MKDEPAFPQMETKEYRSHYNDEGEEVYHQALAPTGGLTKREYFAAMAMQGLCAQYSDITNGDKPRVVATEARDIADALIKQLEEDG